MDVAVLVGIAAIILLIFVITLIPRAMQKPVKYDGYLDVSEQDASQIYQLEIITEPEQLRKQKRVTFKVRIISDS